MLVFVPHRTKCIWIPTQKLEWCGLGWDSEKGILEIPDRRLEGLFTAIDRVLLSPGCTTARKLASVVGMIISMSPVIGNVSRFMTRSLYTVINGRSAWDTPITIVQCQDAIRELIFWKENVQSLNKRMVVRTYEKPAVLAFSDASDKAHGSILVTCDTEKSHAMWEHDESTRSSTWRELKALEFGLLSFKDNLASKTVKWFTDSQNVRAISQVGSRVQELQDIALNIYHICVSNQISLQVEWIPRSLNEKADALSRFVDYDDWGVTMDFFQKMERLWGPHTFDRFANHKNWKVAKFNSKFWVPGTKGVDAFSVDWSQENNWLVPPVPLISQVVMHVIACKAKGTLIVPKWPSSTFWPMVFDQNMRTKWFIKHCVEFPGTNVFVPGTHKKVIFGTERFKSNVLALRLEC